MLIVEEVWNLIDLRVKPLEPRAMALGESQGLTLAEKLLADDDQPACDLSAMDGYAVPENAECGEFELSGEILPGQRTLTPPKAGEALKVFTGSALPTGVKVVMREDVDAYGNKIRVLSMERAGHVRRRGDTAKAGQVLLPFGTILHPAEVGILAANGMVRPKVFTCPTIAHLTTGSEVVAPESRPAEGQVRNSNAPLIRALAESHGASVAAHSHCTESLAEALAICRNKSFADSDLLIVSGGASIGDHDHTAEIFRELEFETVCQKVALRPGKPFLMGVRGRQVAVGLPGNPVSHFVTFHLFVRRILARMTGRPVAVPALGRIADPKNILEPGKLETWWPAIWGLRGSECFVEPLPWLHSGHLSALAGANAILKNPPGELPRETAFFLPCGEPAILRA